MLRDAGDQRTEVSTTPRGGFSSYGQTQWSLREQHRFMAALAGGCLVPPQTRRALLDLMGAVVADQRWGLGEIGLPAQFKGGWGPDLDGNYLVRQMGVVHLENGGRIVVTLAVQPADGSFAPGTEIAGRLAEWVAIHVNAAGARPGSC